MFIAVYVSHYLTSTNKRLIRKQLLLIECWIRNNITRKLILFLFLGLQQWSQAQLLPKKKVSLCGFYSGLQEAFLIVFQQRISIVFTWSTQKFTVVTGLKNRKFLFNIVSFSEILFIQKYKVAITESFNLWIFRKIVNIIISLYYFFLPKKYSVKVYSFLMC